MYSKGSHKLINVSCEFNISDKCVGVRNMKYKDYIANINRNNGKYICLYCSRKLKYSGRNNPNTRYVDIDDNFFEKIDTQEKAYILGFVASDGHLPGNKIQIIINKKDKDILNKIKSYFGWSIPIKTIGDMVSIILYSSKMCMDMCTLLNINPGKKSSVLPAPIGIPDELVSHFIRGFFDGDGSVSNPNINKKNYPIVTIATESDGLREWIVSKINIPCYNSHGRIEWSHNNALDFLGILYKNARIYMDRKYELYTQWCAFVPGLRGKLSSIQLPHLKIIKTRKDAILPDKTRISDSGYDLTIIEKIKQVGDVELFTTGIKIKPEFGWYTIVVPRSSIIKSGYMLANSIGIIDRTYIGEVIIALRKTNVLMPDIKLPCRIAQLIPQPIIHMVIEEVDELPNSDRGECGFGSTGV